MNFVSTLKYFFLSLVFIFTISASPISNAFAQTNETKYERVLVEGVWWIFVYEDGDLIYSYPDDDID